MLRVKKLDENAIVPTCSNQGEDLGYDLYALEDTVLLPKDVTKVRTGVAAQFSYIIGNYGLVVKDRSSMASKGIFTGGGVIDAGYRGEIIVILHDIMSRGVPYLIKRGDKIAQMVPIRVYSQPDSDAYSDIQVVEELPNSERGEKGFGSSGV